MHNGLQGWKLAGGIEYTFPADSPTVSPGEFIVVTRDVGLLRAKFPATRDGSVRGPFSKRLSSTADLVRLVDPDGTIQASVRSLGPSRSCTSLLKKFRNRTCQLV